MMTWKMCAATLVMLIAGAVVGARQPVEHTIAVSVAARCALSADPNRLTVSAGDTIVLRVSGNIPNNCGVPSGAQPAMGDFQQNGKGVGAPVNGGNGRYRVNNGRRGVYKYSITLGTIVLDPELEIGS
jgi:plastocyanin